MSEWQTVEVEKTRETAKTMRRLTLKSFLSPGDIIMMTAAVRDLHLAFPGQFQTDVRTVVPALWENNPYITPLSEDDEDVEFIEMEYPLIHDCNRRPYHFVHGYAQFLERSLGLSIPVTQFEGDIHLADIEKTWMSQVEETGFTGNFWIIVAGGKYDYTAKWWDPTCYQKVVDHFLGRIQFVQCGEKDHWHLLSYWKRDSSGNWEEDNSNPSYNSPVFTGTGNGTIAVTLLANAVTEGFTAEYDEANWRWTLTGTSGDSGSDEWENPSMENQWSITLGSKIKVVITQGSTAFEDGDKFVFSVFKSSAAGGKKNEIAEGLINVADGP